MKTSRFRPLTHLSILLFFLLGFSNFGYSQTSRPSFKQKFSAEDLKKDLKITRENLEKLHIGLYAYTSKNELDKAFDEIEAELDKPLTAMEFFRKLTRLNKLIGNGHTGFAPPKDFMDAIRESLPKFPIEPFWDGENLYVIKNLSSDESIKEGSKIKSINGVSSDVLVKKMASMIKRDGYNKTYQIRRINSDFNLHYSVLQEITDTYEIEFEDNSGNVKKVKLKGLSAEKIDENRFARYQKRKTDWRKTNEPALILSINEDVAIMTIKTFEINLIKQKKQKWKSFFKKSFKRITKEDVKHLVVDLRNNRGGQPAPTIKLLSFLHDKPFTLYKSIETNIEELPKQSYYVDDGSTETFKDTKWVKKGDVFEPKDRDVFKLHKPSKNQYQGKLYILINGFSTSATGTLTGQLKSRTNAIFIGQEAGGNPYQTVARQGVDIILPNSKLKVSIPLVLSVKDVNFENKGRGVVPDHRIKPTIQDKLSGKDVEMEFTLNLIKSGSGLKKK